MIAKLRFLLSRRDKQYLLLLLLFSVFVSLIETIGIGVIMPFIGLASDFSMVHTNEYLSSIYQLFGFAKELDFVVAIGVVLIFFYIFRSAINLFYNYLLVRFAQGRYHLLAYRLFQNYLGLPYREFVGKNSSYLSKTIITEANQLTTLIQHALFLMSEVFVILLIYAMLLYVNLKVTILLSVILAFKIVLLKQTVSKKIKKEGIKRAEFQKAFYETMSASLGNFKLIKLMTNEGDILKKFSKSSYGYARSNTVNGALLHVPRLFLEAVGFGLMIFVMTYLMVKYQTDIKAAIPLLSIYVLALYRLLPSANRIIGSYNIIMYSHTALDIVHAELSYDIEEFGDKKLAFTDSISLQNIYFGFTEGKDIFRNLSLEIKKGEKIAFVGESGVGKSTLVDIIVSLYKPIDGKILVDGFELNESNIPSWRQKIGYIPQSIYLFDGTVGDNVAFGRKIDVIKLVDSLKKANIWDFLSTKEGLDTRVGEGGIILSGGQKQRVAIARALYGDPEVLVLDEATSALDNDTEAKIMDEIYEVSSGKTLIVIAHRLSTTRQCDKVIRIQDGDIV